MTNIFHSLHPQWTNLYWNFLTITYLSSAFLNFLSWNKKPNINYFFVLWTIIHNTGVYVLPYLDNIELSGFYNILYFPLKSTLENNLQVIIIVWVNLVCLSFHIISHEFSSPQVLCNSILIDFLLCLNVLSK